MLSTTVTEVWLDLVMVSLRRDALYLHLNLSQNAFSKIDSAPSCTKPRKFAG
jgi:hypothetical protein